MRDKTDRLRALHMMTLETRRIRGDLKINYILPLSAVFLLLFRINQLSMRAKTIEYKHIMDDNAGSYYDQHVYITHRIANMVVRDIIRQRICNSFP